MIKLRFVTGNDFVSSVIRAAERDGWCSHVEAVLADGSLLGAHFNGGVAIRPAGYDKDTLKRELFVELPGSQFHVGMFYEFLHEQVGKPYDTTGVVGLAVGRDWREQDSWFCSELIAAALEECSYVHRLSSVSNHISPRDLLLVLSGIAPILDAM